MSIESGVGRLGAAVDALVERDDVWMTRDAVERYLSSGQWDDTTFIHHLERHARERPEALALLDEDGRRTTYAEYETRSRALAHALVGLGLSPGDRLAMQLPNGSDFCVTLMGCARAGVVPVLLHMPYTDHDIGYILELTGPRALLVPAHGTRDHVAMARTLQQAHPSVEHVLVLGGDGDDALEPLLERHAGRDAEALEALRPTAVDPFFIMFTSGTTGRPKAEIHLQANNASWVRSFLELHRFPADAHWLLVTPLAHLTALGLGVLSGLARGAPATLLRSWNVDRCVELLARDRPSYLLAAPPMLIDLARHPDLEQAGASLKTICYAGAPCPADVLQTLHRRLGAEIVAFYGYTEAGVTHCTRPGDPIERSSESIGAAVPGIEQRVLGEDGSELTVPCEGELLTRGPGFCPGYWGQPETTRKMFTPDGWFRSADVVRFDERGYGWFVARRDDLINRGGYKIDPREIEEILYTHPRVGQVAVVAMPDERLGQRAVAFVVPLEPGDQITLTDLTAHLEQRGMTKVKWPEAIELLDEFPMTNTGKFMRYALRERARELKPQR